MFCGVVIWSCLPTQDSGRLSSGSTRRTSTDNGLTGSSSSTAAAAAAASKPSSQDAELAKAVAAAEDSEASQQSGNDKHSANTANGALGPDTEGMQWNVSESSSGSAVVSIANREDDLDDKSENVVVNIIFNFHLVVFLSSSWCAMSNGFGIHAFLNHSVISVCCWPIQP